jgi:hypothetical protein
VTHPATDTPDEKEEDRTKNEYNDRRNHSRYDYISIQHWQWISYNAKKKHNHDDNAVHKFIYNLPDESESDVIDLHVCIFRSVIHIPSVEHTAAVITSPQLSSSSEPWRVEL